MLSFMGVVFGVGLLIGGGLLLVRGAPEIAAGFGISPMVVGLMVVGFGASSPELVVSLIGAFEGATGLTFGNVVGSNISNLALVLSAAALVSPLVSLVPKPPCPPDEISWRFRAGRPGPGPDRA